MIDGLGQNKGFRIEDNNYTVEWLEFRNIYGVNDEASILIRSGAASQTGVLLQNLLIHDFFDGTANVIKGIGVQGSGGKVATIRNVMIWNGDQKGIEGDAVNDTITIENCTVDGMANYGIDSFHSQFIVRNTISTRNPSGDFVRLQADGSLTGSNNTSSDLTAAGPPAVFANPQTSASAAALYLDSTGPVLDLHLNAGANVAVDTGLNLSASFLTDIDNQARVGVTWDRGADERDVTTAVRLQSFTARAGDGLVTLEWRTASELDNLGFHVYRASVGERPLDAAHRVARSRGSARRRWDRPTRSATWASRTARATSTGSRTSTRRRRRRLTARSRPSRWAAGGRTESEAEIGREAGRERRCGLLPRLGARGLRLGHGLGERRASARVHPSRRSRGGLARRRLARRATGDARAADGWLLRPSRAFGAGARRSCPASTSRRTRRPRHCRSGAHWWTRWSAAAWSSAASVPWTSRASPASSRRVSERPRCRSRPTAPCGRRAGTAARPAGASRSRELARLLPSVFQGETKSAVVQLSPLRFDPRSRQLTLARRVLVRLLFTGREPGETGRTSRGRRAPRPTSRRQASSWPGSTRRAADSTRWPSRSSFPGRARGFATSRASPGAPGAAGGLPRRARVRRLRPRQPALLLCRGGARPRATSPPRRRGSWCGRATA